MKWVIAGILILVGTWFSLYGERNFNFVLALIGLLFGLLVGHVLTMSYEPGSEIRIAGLLAGGIAGILLSTFLFYVNLALMGVKVGMIFVLVGWHVLFPGSPLEGRMGLTESYLFLAGGFAGGVLALMFRKMLVIVLTSMYGSAAVLGGIMVVTHPEQVRTLVHSESISEAGLLPTIVLLMWAGLTAIASMMQYRHTSTIRNDKKGKDQAVESYPRGNSG
jgi:hypothetical protein